MARTHCLCSLHTLFSTQMASIDVLWNTVGMKRQMAPRMLVNRQLTQQPWQLMMPLPQLFWPQLNSYAISTTRPCRILTQRQLSLSLCHSLSHYHPLVAPLIHASFQLLFFYPPPLVLGARFTVEKYSIFFPPMLSWWVWNVCLGKILWGVWKNNRAVNTKGRPRLASLFQMWSRPSLLTLLQPKALGCNPIHCHYCPTACPSAELCSICVDRLLRDSAGFWMRVNWMCVPAPALRIGTKCAFEPQPDDRGRLEEKKNQQCII